MREDGGLKVINEAMEKLGKEHDRHIKLYDPTGVSGCCFAACLLEKIFTEPVLINLHYATHIHTHTHTITGRGQQAKVDWSP